MNDANELMSQYEDNDPEIDFTIQNSLYLINQRIENLREMIQPSLDEVVELMNLESLSTGSSCDIPENLGVSGKTDQLIAALEAKRVNRDDDQYYDGGDIDEYDEPVSNMNQFYKGLFKESWLNPKSITLLSKEKIPVPNHKYNGKNREITIFDLYETSPPKLTFLKYLTKLWKTTEEEAWKHLAEESRAKQWNLKTRWTAYLEERESKIPSPYQQVLFRCHNLAASPIYDDMEQIGEEHYRLKCGCELRFTDKTAVFVIPMDELRDIPKKRDYNEITFLQTSFTLPEYAHERKRFFRKGGSVKEFAVYLNELGIALSESQVVFLNDLVAHGSLRLYREVLELPERDEIRGYFLNFRKDCQNIKNRVREKLRQSENVSVRYVTRLSQWYPEWMRKIEGLIVEQKEGNPVSVPKPLQISVDFRLPKHSFKLERVLMPSDRLSNSKIPKDTWEVAFVAEMREAYKRDPQIFSKYAEDISQKKVELHCGCQGNNGSLTHGERCPVPVLEKIFKKIWTAEE